MNLIPELVGETTAHPNNTMYKTNERDTHTHTHIAYIQTAMLYIVNCGYDASMRGVKTLQKYNTHNIRVL